MEDKLYEKLDNLNIIDTNLLIDKDFTLSLDSSTRKRIEKSINRKTGYYNENNKFTDKINNILGGILMKRKIALALSVGAVLSLGGGAFAYAKTTPVAYVSMDINPSVELGVNTFDEVVSTEAYNEDGEKVLEGTDLINSDIDDAISTVITNAISEGYIDEDGTSAIEITTSTDKESVATELDESLQEVVDVTLNENNVEAEIEIETVALARRDEARELGITPGKLNLIQKLQALDPTITVEDYKTSSIKDIQKKTKELRKNNMSGEETTTDESTSIDENTDLVTEENAQEGTLSETSVDSEEAKIVKSEKSNNSSNNNGNSKKAENSDVNSPKAENSNVNSKKEESSNIKEEKDTTAEKQNNSKSVTSQENKDSSKSEKSSNSDSESGSSKSNSSKSENSGNSNSSSQNKSNNNGKSKNN